MNRIQYSTRYLSSKAVSLSNQKTLALIKPDLYNQPNEVSKILNILENHSSLQLLYKKEVFWDLEEAESFYSEHRGKFFFQRLTTFMSSGPFLAMVLEGNNAIKDWRSLIGPTRPDRARILQPTTLRAHFGLTDTRNSFHGSDSNETASKEIQLLFPELKRLFTENRSL